MRLIKISTLILLKFLMTIAIILSTPSYVLSSDNQQLEDYPIFTGVTNLIVAGMALPTFVAQLKKLSSRPTFSRATIIMKLSAVIFAPAAAFFLITVPFVSSLISDNN